MRAWMGLASGLLLVCGVRAQEQGEITVPLEKVSVFELGELGSELARGVYTTPGDHPREEVARYPAFQSDRPLFGVAVFGGGAEKVSCHYALDASGGSGADYDRLYLDLDLDRDLSDQRALGPWKGGPAKDPRAMVGSASGVRFEPFRMSCQHGAAGVQSLEFMPRLDGYRISGGKRYTLYFVATEVRRGELELAGHHYTALLGHSYELGVPFDRPTTNLLLFRKGRTQRCFWFLGGDRLSSRHVFGGTLYSFAADPLGERLVVTPYRGEYGRLAIEDGGRGLEQVTMRGSLRAGDGFVAVGEPREGGDPDSASSCRIPVGRYRPRMLSVRYGRLSLLLLEDRREGEEGPREPIEIRAGKTFAIDFHAAPEVRFTSPAQDARLRRGQKVEIAALLVDPALGLKYRSIDDTATKEKQEISLGGGKSRVFERPRSLNPRVLILRASGEKVAEGVMPFG